MLSKRNRLDRKTFDHVFQTGKRTHSPIATLITAPHKQFHGSVVVGKKVAKRAVTRNTYRRRIYDLLRREVLQKPASGIFIILVKPPFHSLSRKEAGESIRELIAQAMKNT